MIAQRCTFAGNPLSRWVNSIFPNPCVFVFYIVMRGVQFTAHEGMGCIEVRLPQSVYNECSHQGQCESDVKFWYDRLKTKMAKMPLDMIRTCLKATGGWDADELTDPVYCMERFLWVAACNCRENQSCTVMMECY